MFTVTNAIKNIKMNKIKSKHIIFMLVANKTSQQYPQNNWGH